MELVADLHIHSHFSIATGREADLEHLDLWSRYKGLQVVGTGDCTHPRWLEELASKLEPAAAGLYALKREYSLPLGLKGPPWETPPPVSFLITGEVSAIYKKGGKVRKVHLLLLLPSLETALKLSQRLSRLGNVSSDGRPILGLDARHLLELTLELDPEALVVPAHIWTPWFSVLGSKSGFDSLEECFEESVRHIYALETGLSSDPAMNWRVSGLDRYRLISNSDAHSPQKLGREANVFQVPPTYPDLARGLRTGEGFGGTLEFFPQEGKYHLDGHRQCDLRLAPEEARRLGGICPRCGKGLTLGVMHRVLDLADRENGTAPPGAAPFESLIALPEILSEVLEAGPGSKKVRQHYFRLLEKLGPELAILRRAPLEALAREGGPALSLAVDKMRRGQVHIAGGYDGVYGEIRLFSPEERAQLEGQAAFFSLPSPPVEQAESPTCNPLMGHEAQSPEFRPNEKPKTKNQKRIPSPPLEKGNLEGFSVDAKIPAPPLAKGDILNSFAYENREELVHYAADDAPLLVDENRKTKNEKRSSPDPLLAGLNPLQREAVTHQGPPLLVQAGPGTGKTRALTHRLAYLASRRGVDPGAILALAFTRQAAREIAARVASLLPPGPDLSRLTVTTFHGLGYRILRDHLDPDRGVLDEEGRRRLLREVAREHGLRFDLLEHSITHHKQRLEYPDDVLNKTSLLRDLCRLLEPEEEEDPFIAAFQAYEAALQREKLWDYEDLIARPTLLLRKRTRLRKDYRARFRHVLIDEYQDLNEAQYRLLRALCGPETELLAIGDPDQAIYGFRGANPGYFDMFLNDWKGAQLCRFQETYRLPPPILKAAAPLRESAGAEPMVTHQPGEQPVMVLEAATPGAEARLIAREIEKLVGGLSHWGLEDKHVRRQDGQEGAGFRDVAVLYRVHALGAEIERGLNEAGIPCQQAREGVGPEWDGLDLAAERVKLLTLHAAKGLEFPYVFIAGCETGLLPWEPPGELAAEPDEEQRLFYVGLTRASRQVFLTRSRVRTVWGQTRRTELSPWVKAIPRELLHRPEPPEPRKREAPQPRLFPEISPRRGKRTK